MNKIITNCIECPFANNDNEVGKDTCNLDHTIYTICHEQLPKDKVHERCPLRKESITITYNPNIKA